MEQADVVVVGGGQGGIPLAVNLSRAGKKAWLFERGALGGSCLNYGCYPSKALLASAQVASAARNADDFGVHLEATVDFTRVMERVRKLSGASAYIQKSLDGAGVNLVRAEASFVGERTVTGGGVTVQAEVVIINTGNNPLIPSIPGLGQTPYLTYLDFWGLSQRPRRLLIIGGGYIGTELGQGLARLGVETHIVEQADRLVAREEADVSEAIMEALRKDGTQLHLGTGVTKVDHHDGGFTLSLESGGLLSGDVLLVAVGQKPNTETLDTAAAGIELDERGFIAVDACFRTSAPGVYAIGDVTGQPAFTHVSWEDFRRLMSILAGGDRRQGDRVLGYAIFTDPEVARAGMISSQAEEEGYKVREAQLPLTRIARAYVSSQEQGFYRLVVDAETDRILGATLVGPGAGELIHVIIDLMEAGATWHLLDQSVHIHQTLAEGLPTLARQLEGSKPVGEQDNSPEES